MNIGYRVGGRVHLNRAGPFFIAGGIFLFYVAARVFLSREARFRKCLPLAESENQFHLATLELFFVSDRPRFLYRAT